MDPANGTEALGGITMTTTTQHDDEQHDHAVLVAKIFILSFISVFGTIGNIVVVYTIQNERKLRIPGNFFIINLTMANLLITAFSIPVIISNLIREVTDKEKYKEFSENIQSNGFCQGSAYIKTLALHASWYTLAFIALNRYYTVCRMNEYANNFTRRHILITIGLIWVWVVIINIPIMIGWAIPNGKILDPNSTEGYYTSYPKNRPPVVYDGSSHDCVLGVNNHGGYTYANGLFVMAIPLIAIVFCYSLVYMAIVQSRRKMKAAMDIKQLKRRYNKERKISVMLAVVVIVFLLCWIPAIIYDYKSNPSNTFATENDNVRLFVNWLALSNCAMNSILFAAMSKAFRIGYKRMLLKILRVIVCCCCNCESAVKNKLNEINSTSRSSITVKVSETRKRDFLTELGSKFTLKRPKQTKSRKIDTSFTNVINGKDSNLIRLQVPTMTWNKKKKDVYSLNVSEYRNSTVYCRSYSVTEKQVEVNSAPEIDTTGEQKTEEERQNADGEQHKDVREEKKNIRKEQHEDNIEEKKNITKEQQNTKEEENTEEQNTDEEDQNISKTQQNIEKNRNVMEKHVEVNSAPEIDTTAEQKIGEAGQNIKKKQQNTEKDENVIEKQEQENIQQEQQNIKEEDQNMEQEQLNTEKDQENTKEEQQNTKKKKNFVPLLQQLEEGDRKLDRFTVEGIYLGIAPERRVLGKNTLIFQESKQEVTVEEPTSPKNDLQIQTNLPSSASNSDNEAIIVSVDVIEVQNVEEEASA